MLANNDHAGFSSFRKKLLLAGYTISAAFLGLFAYGWGTYSHEIKTENIGDYIGAAASTLAFVWVLIGIYLQGYEISLQTKEMSESKHELARQAEALVEQISLIKEQARIVASQVELSKVATAQSMYENLLTDLSREIRTGTTGLVAYDSEQHISHLDESRKSGNIREYVDTFYIDLLGIPQYDLIGYIDWITCGGDAAQDVSHEAWRISDTVRLSLELCGCLAKNLRSIARFNSSIRSLQMQEYQTYDFLEHVLASLCSIRHLSRIWHRLSLPMGSMRDLLAPYAQSVDSTIPSYLDRIQEYPDWSHWGVLRNIKRCNGLLEMWQSADYADIGTGYPYVVDRKDGNNR